MIIERMSTSLPIDVRGSISSLPLIQYLIIYDKDAYKHE